MADPVLVDHYRALAVFQRASGLPRDVVVNSWAFRNDGTSGPPETVAAEIASALDTYYTANHQADPTTIASHIDSSVTGLEYRVYDLGQAVPREPHIVESTAFTGGSGSPLPGEVALCMSYFADRNLPRSRGRVYIGPLNTSTVDAVDSLARPSAALVRNLRQGGEYLLNPTENLTWVLISQADAAAKVITGGWVDNAFDTQRRRGVDPTTRTVYPEV